MGLGIPLVVIVIFLVVWIVSNVIRAQQDAAQAAARRDAGKRQVAAGSNRTENKGNSDIDRFLQEIDRLRKKGQQEKVQQQNDESSAPPPKPKPIADRRTDPPRSRTGAPRPTREPKPAPPAPVASPPRPRESAPIVAELLTARDTGQTASKPGSLALSIETKAETARVAAETASKFVPGMVGRTTVVARPHAAGTIGTLPPTLLLVQKLFQSKQGAAAAVLLHEIFGPPRSRKA